MSTGCSTALPQGDQQQLALIDTIRDPRKMNDFQTVLGTVTDLNFVDETGKTPLIYAIERGNTVQIWAMLKRGANPALLDQYGYTALHHAAVLPDSEALRIMLEAGVSPDLPGGDRIQNKTALMEAARVGEAGNVELLLKRGADLTLCDDRGRTALMFAAMAPKYSERVVKMLLQRKAESCQADKNGLIPLFLAIDANNQDAAMHLLSLLPDFDKQDQFVLIGLTAMRHAIDAGNLEMVKAILAKKLPVNSELSRLYKVLQFATVEGWYKILAENDVIANGQTPLFWAAQNDNVQIILLLLAEGADPTAKDHAGAYASEYSRQRESTRILRSAAKEWRAKQLRELEEKSKR